MDDEGQQVYQDSFNHIVLGLSLAGLVGGALAFALDGAASPWFLRSIALLLVAVIAWVLQRAGHFAVAAYVLVLELIGLVVGMLLQANTLTGFIPYLFIPIIIIASLIVSPQAILALAIFSIGLVLAVVALTGQFTSTNLLILLPPFGMLILTALLSTLSGRHVVKVDGRLQTSQQLLRERTLDMLRALEDIKELQERVDTLKEQLARSHTEISQVHQAAAQKDRRFYPLIKGTILELKHSLKKLEQLIEGVAERPDLGLPQVAWQNIDHLTNLVVNLEEITRLENDEIRLNRQPLDMAQLLNEVSQTAQGLAREKNLELRCSVSEKLPRLLADPLRLRQALLHLLGNAVKYTDQGLIELQTELSATELIIFISDTGMGLSAEELDTIFQPFGRGQKALVKQRAGAGLGLSLTRRIVELHGGRLWATSVLGVGSTFCMALPLELDPEQTVLSLPAVTLPAVVPAPRETQPVNAVASPVKQESTGPAFSQASAASQPQPASADPPLHQTQVNFSPVARFSPVYISRFGLTLLSLLVIIAGIVLALAVVNGPNKSQAKVASATPQFLPGSMAGTPQVSKTPPLMVVATPVSTVTASATPSPTLMPTATAPASIKSQEQTVQPVLPTPTPLKPTHTPSATSTPSPTATPLPSPSFTPTSTPTPVIIPTATPLLSLGPTPVAVVPPPAKVNPPDLSFVSSQRIAPAIKLLNFDPQLGLGLAAVPGATNNYGFSWQADQLLFSGQPQGNREIYLLQPGSGSPLPLSPAEGDDLQPAWSPDGRYIAFSSGRGGNLDIYIMDATGNNLVQLTTSRGFDEWPAWSPDGRQIAFVSDRDGNVEIYLMNADGSNQQRLTHHPADDWPVAWAPDSQRLLFASNRDSNWNLYLLEINGGDPTRLTNDPGDERDPAWSPDGRTIAFAYNGGENWDIYTLSAPSNPAGEISRSEWTQVTATSIDERSPAWLP